ncbi:tripartite tricarboxylate transporter substrate binding protein [Roseateles sp. SL47]|uniref:Bug family tripartite tricarboxylate transporter substrate binding protein n=1 Tax=Roseateles sp. SL47 TaxID=2995138 RepID=UPI00226DCCD7|nr:tripartite tricarboxylate transporter substrate binding protein [Roseateles sp. SL47]WAC70995.1 tripartite tricarboxylate transporter substrate binding protein [Roseateles sp. SL47]
MKLVKVLIAVMSSAVIPLAAGAQPFPEKGSTLRIIVPFAAGGGVDNAARLLAEQLRKQLGTPVVVENKAGASGTLGGKAVQVAPADGYTMLFSAATHVLAKEVMATAPYDPQTDFVPIARVGEAPLMLVIAPALAPRTLGQMIGAAKSKPDEWMAAIPAAGAPSHLATLLFAKQAGLKLTYVPYKGTQPALVDVGGNHVSLLLDSMVSLVPLAKSGKVRPLAITAEKRSSLAPEVPTMQEAGLKDFKYASWYGVWVPKGTPADRVARLSAAVTQASSELGRNGAYAAIGVEALSEGSEQFKKFIAADVAQGTKLLRSSGFKPE